MEASRVEIRKLGKISFEPPGQGKEKICILLSKLKHNIDVTRGNRRVKFL